MTVWDLFCPAAGEVNGMEFDCTYSIDTPGWMLGFRELLRHFRGEKAEVGIP